METILPEFKDINENNAIRLIAILTVLFFIIPPVLVFFFMGETLSPAAKSVTKAFLNFEILIFILLFICGIPVLGWLVAPLLAPFACVAHLIVTIGATLCIINNQPIKIWVPVKFIQ